MQSSVREKHEEMVALLLSKNADINYVTKETQETALGLACASNFFEIADFLIRAGANLELGGHTPLQISCQEGHLELVKHLIDCGADVNARSPITGDTALHFAIDYPEIVRYLILANADIEAENDLGLTCLQKAIQNGRLNTIQVLVECGANITELEPTTTASPAITTKPPNKKSSKSKSNNSQIKNQTSTSMKDIDPIHQKIHEQHMMLVNGANENQQQQQLHLTLSDDNQPILCDKHASEFVECSNMKRKLSQQHCTSEDNGSDLLESQAFEQLTNYFQKQRNELNSSNAGNGKKKARLKQQPTNSNSLSQTDEHICNELLGYELLSSKKLKSAMKNQPDRCIKLIDELMCKLNSENRLTPDNDNSTNTTAAATTTTTKVNSLTLSSNHKLNALKETERLEQCINHMMRRTELLNPSKEEQIKQKQQILEELQRVEKELQEKAQAQLLLSHHTHQKEKFLKSLCAQSQHHKQQLASIKNQTNSPDSTLDTSDTNAKLDSISFSLKKGLSKLISLNQDTTNCLLDNATNSATDHPSDCADLTALLNDINFDKDISDEEFLESLKKCDSTSDTQQQEQPQQQEQQQQAILETDQKLKMSNNKMNKKLRNLLKTNCNLKDDLNKVLNSLSSDYNNQSNNYQMVTLPKIAEEIKKMQTHLSNQQNQLEQLDQLDGGNQQVHTQQDDLQQVHEEDEEQEITNTTTNTNTDDELSALFDTFQDKQVQRFKELSKKMNIDNPELVKILYEFPSTSDCSEQDNQAIIIEETEEEDGSDELDDEQSDDDELADQDDFFEQDQLTGDHHIVHERRVFNLKQYPNFDEMINDNQQNLFCDSEDDEIELSNKKAPRSDTNVVEKAEFFRTRSTQTYFSSSPDGTFKLIKKPMRKGSQKKQIISLEKLNEMKNKAPNKTSADKPTTSITPVQACVDGKCVSVSESFVRKKSMNVSSRDHLTSDQHSSSSSENLATIESLCNNLNANSINNLYNEQSKGNSNRNKNSLNVSKDDDESRRLIDQIMKLNKLKSENQENKDIKRMINQWALEVSKNSHLLTKSERMTNYPKETISELVLTTKKDSPNNLNISSSQNKENAINASTSAMNETSLLLVENENKGNIKMSNKQSTKLAKKLIKSTLKKETKNSKVLNSNNDLNKSSIKIQSATINNPNANSSNQQTLRNHVRNIMKAKRTLNQTTITEEHHTQVTISSRSKDNCSKIDLKMLEERLPDEYNKLINQMGSSNFNCFNKNTKRAPNNDNNKNSNSNSNSNNGNNNNSNINNTGNKTKTGNKNTQNKSTKIQNNNSRKQNEDNDGKSHDTVLTLVSY